MQTIRKYLPGMAVCLAIVVPSWLLGKLVPASAVRLIKQRGAVNATAR